MERLKKIFSDRRIWFVAGAIAIMAIIALAYFYPDDVQGNVLQQHDMRQGLANGQEAKVFTETTGEDTRWTNSLFGGMPTFQIAPSYPSNSLFSWLNSVLTLGLPEPANLLFLMMLGFFILLMTMRMRWYVALIGAIAYGFSSYFIIIINAGHIWKFVTLAYIPPTIAGIVLSYRGRYLAGAAVTALFGMLQIASNHVQMTYYFLFVVAGFIVASLVTAIRAKRLRQWYIATASVAVAAILAFVANLPSLYNTYEYAKETTRGNATELVSESDGVSDGTDRDYLRAYSYGGSETFSLLIPNIKGGATILPEQGSFRPMVLSDLDAAEKMRFDGEISYQTDQYMREFESMGALRQYFGEPEGTNGPVYVGALICALFLLGCFMVRGPMKWTLVVLTLFSILIALGRNCLWLSDFMISYVPMFNKFRAPESALVIAEFTMPLLAAMALQSLLSVDRKEAWDRFLKPVLWSFGAMLILCLIGIIAPKLYGGVITEFEAPVLNQMPELYDVVEKLRLGMVVADSMRSFMIVSVGLLLLFVYMRGKLSTAWTVAGIGAVVLVDLFAVNKRYLNHDCFMPAPVSTDEVFVMSDADKHILADTAKNYRVLDVAKFSSADPSYYHKSIGGYHAAKLTRYEDLLKYYFRSEGHDYSPVLNMLNTKYIITDPTVSPLANPEALGNAWLVDRIEYVATPNDEIAAIERIDISNTAVADKKFEPMLGASAQKSAGDTIFETSYAPNRLTYHVRSEKGGVAVFSEIYFPWGWHVTIDGKRAELGRVNYVLRALKVPAGSHTVEMWFDPESLHTTTAAAYVAVIAIYLLLAAAAGFAICRKIRNDDKTDPEADGGPQAR